jgi:hypothetical protein
LTFVEEFPLTPSVFCLEATDENSRMLCCSLTGELVALITRLLVLLLSNSFAWPSLSCVDWKRTSAQHLTDERRIDEHLRASSSDDILKSRL